MPSTSGFPILWEFHNSVHAFPFGVDWDCSGQDHTLSNLKQTEISLLDLEIGVSAELACLLWGSERGLLVSGCWFPVTAGSLAGPCLVGASLWFLPPSHIASPQVCLCVFLWPA